jgi:hypothetical protein
MWEPICAPGSKTRTGRLSGLRADRSLKWLQQVIFNFTETFVPFSLLSCSGVRNENSKSGAAGGIAFGFCVVAGG